MKTSEAAERFQHLGFSCTNKAALHSKARCLWNSEKVQETSPPHTYTLTHLQSGVVYQNRWSETASDNQDRICVPGKEKN